jgi:geranylgeranyl diphosphate synthase type II
MKNEKLRLVDSELNILLPTDGKLAKAMRYSVFAGGKRFRPLLCIATAKALGASTKKVLPYACAVEMIHTFTLIHDDLPAMDNSDLRRGKPTCHKVFGEALAILSGDALNTLAFEIIAEYPAAVQELARALLLVVEGQVADIESTQKKLTLRDLKKIHQWKTAALLKACVRGTAIICQAKPKEIAAFTQYADHLGLAFQITDDILDVTATSQQLGKPARADVKKGFPFVVGLAKAKELAAFETQQALKALSGFDQKAVTLRRITENVLSRQS